MRPEGPLMVMGPLAYRVGTPRVAGVMLAGDAAGFYDPFSGEGLYRALRSAELLAEVAHPALASGDVSAGALAAYDRAKRAAFGDKARVTHALQFVIAHRRVANAAARILRRRPAVMSLLMGVIGDFVPPRALLRAPHPALSPEGRG